MTTTAPPAALIAPSRGHRPARAPRVTFRGILASEWTKLLTLRSTVFVVLATLLIGVGGSYLQAIATTGGRVPTLGGAAATASVLNASTLGSQLVLAVLAVLIMGGEYSTGMIAATLTSVPRRLPVLAAKAIVVAVTSVVLTLAAEALAYAATISRLDDAGVGTSLIDAAVLRSVAADAAYVLAIALFALLVATVIRNTAASIAVVMAVLFVLPAALSFMIGDTGLSPAQFTLTYAAQMTTALLADPASATHVARNAVLLAAWLGVPAVAGIALLKRRDA